MSEPSFLLEWQIILASFMALLLNVCWVPVIDLITDGKYGTVNAKTIFILSASMPFLYLNNYLWTINFSKSKLKLIFYIMTATFAVNLVGCSILIPLYQNEGAAVAFFVTIIIQSVIYLKITPFSMPVASRYRLLLWPGMAFTCGLIAHKYFTNSAVAIALPLFIYMGTVFISRQFRGKDWKTLQALYQ
jgi:O-antigen/teichoic acid export membrane protein